MLEKQPRLLRSWDTFAKEGSIEHGPIYISEAGPAAFDAALTLLKSDIDSKIVRQAKPDVFLASLLNLGLGRQSALFMFNEQQQIFSPRFEPIALTGYSQNTIGHVVASVSRCGLAFRVLQRFMSNTSYKTGKARSSKVSPVLVAFSDAVSAILQALEAHITAFGHSELTLLQMQALFSRCEVVIVSLQDCLPGDTIGQSDGQILSAMFSSLQVLMLKHEWLAEVLGEVLQQSLTPWLRFLEVWSGLRIDSTPFSVKDHLSGFIDAQQLDGVADPRDYAASTVYSVRHSSVPTFLEADQVNTVYETGKALQLLRARHPHHPLSRPSPSSEPRLRIALTWSDVEVIHQKATAYEQQLRDAIKKYNSGSEVVERSSETNAATAEGAAEVDVLEAYDFASTEPFGKPLGAAQCPQHNLATRLSETHWYDLEKPLSGPELLGPSLDSAINCSLSPFLLAQDRLVGYSCLRMLFKEYDIRFHLNLQWRFQLFGDGNFASMLSHALFDPDMDSGERKKGVVRGGVRTGLRLGTRDTWPPASSELRLVLLGLLTDCYERDSPSKDMRKGLQGNERQNDLPGGLSFSIRELSDEELERCRDPNALEALDFLRVHYKPPPVLADFITSKSLDKYDRLCKHLLRLIRMQAVTTELTRAAANRHIHSVSTRHSSPIHRFRIEAQTFIQTLSQHSFQTGIGASWSNLEQKLAAVDACFDNEDIEGALRHASSVYMLRGYHEQILDDLIFSLGIGKRHSQAQRLLEEIFRLILLFARKVREINASSSAEGMEEAIIASKAAADIQTLYARFGKQVRRFMDFLRGSEGTGAGSKRKRGLEDGESVVVKGSGVDVGAHAGQLLLRLEMNKYWTK